MRAMKCSDFWFIYFFDIHSVAPLTQQPVSFHLNYSFDVWSVVLYSFGYGTGICRSAISCGIPTFCPSIGRMLFSTQTSGFAIERFRSHYTFWFLLLVLLHQLIMRRALKLRMNGASEDIAAHNGSSRRRCTHCKSKQIGEQRVSLYSTAIRSASQSKRCFVFWYLNWYLLHIINSFDFYPSRICWHSQWMWIIFLEFHNFKHFTRIMAVSIHFVFPSISNYSVFTFYIRVSAVLAFN